MKKIDSGLISGCIRHASLIYIVVAVVLAFGIVGLVQMNKDELPAFTIRQGIVAGVYPGASPEEVEEQFVKPLEELLFTMPEVNREGTYAISKEGIAYVYVDLDLSVKDKDVAWSKIRHKLNEAKTMTFPAGVLAVVVIDDFGNTSSVLIAMESEDKTYSELHEYTKDLEHRLRQIPTMGNVKVMGEQDEEIAVSIRQEQLAGYDIDPKMLLLGYATQNLITTKGNFETDDFNMPIHITNSLNSEKEIEEQIIKVLPNGEVVRTKDIASVERRYKKASNDVNFNGKNAIVISVEMRKGNNIVKFGDEVEKVLSEFSKTLPDSVKMYRITDQPKVVGRSVTSFLRDLVISMIVVIVVMLMLFPIRTALVASSGVPICTAAAIGLMYLCGIELNTVTLAALILVLGMIVDDSIINIDGFIDKLQKGYEPHEAAVTSAKELFTPMFIATMGICAMFFPIKVLITGPLGDFVQLFPWTVLFALSSSLVYAMLVIPSLEIKFITLRTDNRKFSKFEDAQNKFFNFIQNAYDNLQVHCFRHPAITITLGVASIAIGLWMFTRINVQMMPNAERDCFAIELRLSEGSSLNETIQLSDSLQKMILEYEGVTSTTAFIGEPAPRFHVTYAPSMPSDNLAQIIVNTQSKDMAEKLLPVFDERFSDCFSNAYVRIRQLDYQAVSTPIEIYVYGDDYDDMSKVSQQIKQYMTTLPDELRWVHSDYDEFVSSLKVTMHPEECARLGISQANLSLNLASTLNGQPLTTLWEDGNKVPVNLYYDNISNSVDYNDLGNQLIQTSIPSVWVPLRQIADIEPEWHAAQLVRRNGKNCITIGADMKFWVSQVTSMKKISHFIDTEVRPNLPDGVTVEYGGLNKSNAAVIPQITISMIVAVLILFIFMVVYFKKLGIAMLTIAASSLCLFGAFFGEWIFGLDFGMTSVLGVVSLVGIIVRNGIVMYEYAEELRLDNGLSAREAAMEAGSRRMRPIFLTSCTTALGVLPMIISRNPLWMPMGVVICFGVILSLVIVLSVMPVTYWQIYKKKGEI